MGDSDSGLTTSRARWARVFAGLGPSARHNQVLKPIASGTAGHSLSGRSSVGPSLEAQRRIWLLSGRPALQSGRFRGPTIGAALSAARP